MSGVGERLFDWSDYLVFACMLAVSAAIGLYHGCRRGRTGQSSAEFLTGNGQLGTVPVALSMLARSGNNFRIYFAI
jgi:Na+/proline symporter